MSQPLRADDPDRRDSRTSNGAMSGRRGVERVAPSPLPRDEDDPVSAELAMHAREQAEALAAVSEVMQREQDKAAAQKAKELRPRRRAPLKLMLLGALLLFNAYAWAGNPEWLHFREPQLPAVDYYESSWKLAVYLQRQRVEEFRAAKGHLPATASQAGPPVKGVEYTPLETRTYQLAAGSGSKRFVYLSSDSLSMMVGRAFVRMSLIAGGAR